MKLVIGVPNAGTKIVLDIADARPCDGLEERVTDALEVLQLAGATWRDWSLEHETEEEKQTRLLMEKNRLLSRQAIERQNVELEQMLAGQTEGIGKIGRGA